MNVAFNNGQPLVDHWDPTLGCGYPFLRTYPHLIHLIVWAVSRLSGGNFHANYVSMMILLWALWPACLFLGFKLLGLADPIPIFAAGFSTIIHSSLRFGVSFETFFHFGLGPNLLGLCLFPIALGLGYRFIQTKQFPISALLLFILTWFGHLVMGYILCLSLLLLATTIFFEKDGSRKPKILRCFSLLSFGVIACSFFLFPFFLEGATINKTELEPATYWSSYTLSTVLSSSIRGEFFDSGRTVPFMSLFFLLGIFFTLTERRYKKWPLWICLFWFTVYPNFFASSTIRWALPLSHSFPFERMIIACHIFSLILIANGINGTYCHVKRRWPKLQLPAVALFVIVPILVGNFVNYRYSRHLKTQSDQLWSQSGDSELHELIALETLSQTGKRCLVPGTISKASLLLNSMLTLNGLPQVGFQWHTMSQNSDFIYNIDVERKDHLELFNINRLYVLKTNRARPCGIPIQKTKYYNVLEMSSQTTLFSSGMIVKNLPNHPQQHRQEINSWLNSNKPESGIYLGFGDIQNNSLDSQHTAPALQQIVTPISDGVFGYQLTTESAEDTFLIGKFTYHPKWEATIDGEPTSVFQVSPSFVAIILPKGTHSIKFTFEPGYMRRWLLGLALLLLISFPFLNQAIDRRLLKQPKL